MYKILLVTDQADVVRAFDGVAWESLGYRLPRRALNAHDAMESLKTHHADAICYALPEEDEKLLFDYLCREKPYLPILTARREPSLMTAAVERLSALLARLHADYSNDDFGLKDMLQLCRHDYVRTMLSGTVEDASTIPIELKMLRSKMDPSRSCVVFDLSLPKNDNFMSVRWHYGHERLEVALRNFIGAEFDGMRVVCSVLPDEQIRVLCCPMIGAEVSHSVTAPLTEHVQSAMADIDEYLGIHLSVRSVQVLPNLLALAKQIA